MKTVKRFRAPPGNDNNGARAKALRADDVRDAPPSPGSSFPWVDVRIDDDLRSWIGGNVAEIVHLAMNAADRVSYDPRRTRDRVRLPAFLLEEAGGPAVLNDLLRMLVRLHQTATAAFDRHERDGL